jgi:hypothetical protein
MSHLSGYGISVALPAGFEGRIFRRTPPSGGAAYPVVQAATFVLPANAGDFGGGATTLMRPTDVFAVLFQFGPESLGRPLFARAGMPRSLQSSQFHPYVLRQGLGNQSGTQWFFTEAGRPFTLYVVLGNHALRDTLVPTVNTLLGQFAFEPPAA